MLQIKTEIVKYFRECEAELGVTPNLSKIQEPRVTPRSSARVAPRSLLVQVLGDLRVSKYSRIILSPFTRGHYTRSFGVSPKGQDKKIQNIVGSRTP